MILEAGLLPERVGVVGVFPAAGAGAILFCDCEDCELDADFCRSLGIGLPPEDLADFADLADFTVSGEFGAVELPTDSRDGVGGKE